MAKHFKNHMVISGSRSKHCVKVAKEEIVVKVGDIEIQSCKMLISVYKLKPLSQK